MSQGVNDAGDGDDLVLYALTTPGNAADIPGIDATGGGTQNAEFNACMAGVDHYGATAANIPVGFPGGDGLWVDNTGGAADLTTYLFVNQYTDPTMANYADATFYLLVDFI